MTLSGLHNIFSTSGWILTKFAWIYNLDITNTCIDFGDLELIYNVSKTAVGETNSVDSDQMPHSPMFDLLLHCCSGLSVQILSILYLH